MPLGILLPTIRRAISEAEPGAMVWTARTMDDYLAEPLAQPRLNALLMSVLGFVALGACGYRPLWHHGVGGPGADTRHRSPNGARCHTGSHAPRRPPSAHSRSAAAGAAAGFVLAVAMSRMVRSLLFDVSPADPVALLGACAILLTVALVAAYFPARRASQIDPARSLQMD